MRFDRTQSDGLSESKPNKINIFPGHTVKAHVGSRGVVALDLDVGTSAVSSQLHTAVPVEQDLAWASEPVGMLRIREKCLLLLPGCGSSWGGPRTFEETLRLYRSHPVVCQYN